jgi:Asp-tRNA(Asn)/Glu-tRNA(Gln) amidotransferase A subunit family amidase
MSDGLCYLSGAAALDLFRRRALSPVELMRATIDRAAAVEPKINAFTESYFEQALAQAHEAERRYLGHGPAPRPLEGLPLAVKEEFRVAGTRRCSGSLIFCDRVDDETDPLIGRLLDAGAIMHAKTTVPEWCLIGTTHSRQWGVTRNPWKLDTSPGGSSGGSGAALAAGTTTLATGTDIGGSIRIPAALCGVAGYKPPYGRNPEIPVYNLDFFAHSGPMARSVADLALMQNVISGVESRDIASLRERVVLPTAAPADLRGWKIAYSLDLGCFEVDDAVRRATLGALEVFRSLGAEIEPVDLRWTREMMNAGETYLGHLWGASVAELLAEHRAQMTDYAIAFGEQADRSTAKDFRHALGLIAEMYGHFGPLLDRYDLFVCPTLATSAVPAELVPQGRLKINGLDRPGEESVWTMTTPFNMLSRCPVLAVPSGGEQDGVPIGIQLVARTYDDERVFRAGLAYEAARPWFGPAMATPGFA